MLRVENKTKTSKTAKTRDGFVAGKWMLSQQYTLLCSDSCKSIERRFYRWKVNVVTTTLPPVFGQMQKQRERDGFVAGKRLLSWQHSLLSSGNCKKYSYRCDASFAAANLCLCQQTLTLRQQNCAAETVELWHRSPVIAQNPSRPSFVCQSYLTFTSDGVSRLGPSGLIIFFFFLFAAKITQNFARL